MTYVLKNFYVQELERAPFNPSRNVWKCCQINYRQVEAQSSARQLEINFEMLKFKVSHGLTI